MFKYFVIDSRHGLNPVHDNIYILQTFSKSDRDKNKYQIDSDSDWLVFSESR